MNKRFLKYMSQTLDCMRICVVYYKRVAALKPYLEIKGKYASLIVKTQHLVKEEYISITCKQYYAIHLYETNKLTLFETLWLPFLA